MLPHQIVSKRKVGLLGQQLKTGGLVNVFGRVQVVVGPQTQLMKAPVFGKSDAFTGQAPAQTGTAHLRLHIQQAQLGLGV